jgi:NUC153 domain
LTWDNDDPERNRITRRTFTRAEIEESDFKAFLASSSSDSESEAGPPSVSKSSSKSKANSTKVSRHKLRVLLLGGDGELPEGWSGNNDEQGDVDMEVTFTPGLSEKKDRDESTLDKYQRKMKEKRKKKKGEVKEKVLKERSHGSQDEFFDDGRGDKHRSDQSCKPSAPPNSTQKPQLLSDTASGLLSAPEEPKLLVPSNTLDAEPKHFNIKSIVKAEKVLARKRKNRKKHKQEDDNELQDDFSIDVKDVRFKALHDDHQYAIDPSNPQCVSFDLPISVS